MSGTLHAFRDKAEKSPLHTGGKVAPVNPDQRHVHTCADIEIELSLN